MKAKQAELNFAQAKNPTMQDIPYGGSFRIPAERNIFIKVRPVGQLCNSKLLTDIIGRGDCLVVNTLTGVLKYAPATLEVIPVDATIMWEDKQ